MMTLLHLVSPLGFAPPAGRFASLQPRPSLVASTAEQLIRLGDPWWLYDKDELSRELEAAPRRQYFAVVGCVATLCVSSLIWSTRKGALRWAATPWQAARSPVLTAGVLIAWRVAAAIGITSLTVARACRASTGVLEDLDRRGRGFRYSGIWRFQGLTSWSWLLINAYFLLTAGLTVQPSPSKHAASVVAGACRALMGSAFAFALLVTSVVSFVLIPSRRDRQIGLSEYFRPQALVMHNANVALMGVEVWVSGMAVQLHQLPLALLFGCLYVTYHNGWRYQRTRTLLYFFLNWTRPDATRTLVVLLALFGGCYWVGYAASALLRPRAWGAPCFALALLSIMRVRPPPPSPPAVPDARAVAPSASQKPTPEQ